MKATVVGTGYVGLVTGVCLAAIGHDVICIDNNPEKVELLKGGTSPIYEPGLEELLAQTIESGRIHFSEDLASGVEHGEVIFIAVGTPALPSGESDMRYVEAVARGIGRHLSGSYKVIVNKSTVPVGSGDWVRMLILDGILERERALVPSVASNSQELPRHHFDVVSNPEFLREGTAVYDTFNPDRIVLGSDSAHALETMQELYEPLVTRRYVDRPDMPAVPVLLTDLSSAEMIKYAANAFLATKISFINEVANICDRVGADVTRVAQGIGLDSRIGRQFLNAGIGWGGSCFPKDVSALTHIASDYGYESKILQAVIDVNQSQRLVALEKLQRVLKILKGKTIGLLGLTFKPDTDDMRDAASLTLIEQLNRLGAKVKAYDPLLSPHKKPIEGTVLTQSAEELADGCDALVLVTEWRDFLTLDYKALAGRMRQPILLDGRNFLDRSAAESAGFRYYGIGR
jgi:UDPglucose 6-dehydrogenase